MPMTNVEYSATKGRKCPNCGSANLVFKSPIARMPNNPMQDMECRVCKAEWQSEFVLSAYIPKATYDHMYAISFTIKGCLTGDGTKVTAGDVRAAIYARIQSLADDELVNESIELLDTTEEQE